MSSPFDAQQPAQFGAESLTIPRGPQEGENTFRWGTVTSVSPLRVRLDGEASAVPITPDTLISVDALKVNLRVWVQMFGRRMLITGIANYGAGLPVYGRVIQGTTTIPSTSTTPVTLATFTLPAAGTYDVTLFARAQLTGTSGWGVAQLHDPSGTLVPDSEIFVTYFIGASSTTGNTAVGRIMITTTGAATYTLRGRSGGAYTVNWTTSVDGRTGVQWIQAAGSATGPTGPTGPQGPPGTGFPPTAFDVAVNDGAYGQATSFATAGTRPGMCVVTNAQTDGPIASTYFVCETRHYQGTATWVTQHAYSPFGASTGPDTRRWMRQMYGGSGNTWGPWEQVAGPVPWTNVSFLNSWVNYGSPYQTAQYRKVGDEVQLRGLIRNGTAGAAMFNLPAGYRPAAEMIFDGVHNTTVSWASGAASAGTAHTHTQAQPTALSTRINVSINGDVLHYSTQGTAYLDISSIRFSVTP